MNQLSERGFEQEFIFQASRSSGAGGQHVNKVASKVELRFHVEGSQALTEEEKALIQQKLGNRITGEGYLQLHCQESRSQIKNKELCIERFYELLNRAFQKEKKRKPTKPSWASVKRRLENKQKQAQKKANRSQRGLF